MQKQRYAKDHKSGPVARCEALVTTLFVAGFASEAGRGLYWQGTCTGRSLSPLGKLPALRFNDSPSDELNRDACLSARDEKRIRTARPSCVRSLCGKVLSVSTRG